MKKGITSILLLIVGAAHAQTVISGKITDASTHQPLAGISILVLPAGVLGVSDPLGNFILRSPQAPASISFSSIGYARKTMTIAQLQEGGSKVELMPQIVELADITVSSNAGEQFRPISRTDIAMRGVSNSQEVLRIIPGLVIGQHQGGGKAEQIFLRGFDCDHGTDIRLEADGMPINMVSHAHGQGFADSHFIIPETIGSVDFNKGPYTPSMGDFSTTGYAEFNTRNFLPSDMAKVEGGMFNTWRALAMVNLLGEQAREKQQSWYVASEYRYSNGYFDNPQFFTRANLFTKYNGKLSEHNFLTVSATTFWSKWDASGQIPDRAVAKGLIGWFGALDPLEGGKTYRTNLNAQLATSLNNGDVIKNQVYYSNYHFDLHTNFTFYLVDTVNGDEIRQREARDLWGYNGSYRHIGYVGDTRLTTEAGLQVRYDRTHNSELSHTMDRFTLLNRIKLGDISELSLSPYLAETIDFSPKFSLTAGLRYDRFYHRYDNKFAGDTTLSGIGVYKAQAGMLSPKLNLYYHVNKDLQFYLTTGRGFHSNDTRAVVVEHGIQVLPAAYSADLGTVFKPLPRLLINAAIWEIALQQEFVYGGDGGSVEFSGKTRRYGFDLSARYEPIKSLYVDLDLNYAHGRSVDDAKGQNYIPLAPVWTSSGGITYAAKQGFNGSLRYRYLADRPANADYSLTATGYFVTDAVLNYSWSKYELGLVVNNVFNVKWKETQFDTVTRLKGETHSVEEVCFTPGTPFAAKLSFAVRF